MNLNPIAKTLEDNAAKNEACPFAICVCDLKNEIIKYSFL